MGRGVSAGRGDGGRSSAGRRGGLPLTCCSPQVPRDDGRALLLRGRLLHPQAREPAAADGRAGVQRVLHPAARSARARSAAPVPVPVPGPHGPHGPRSRRRVCAQRRRRVRGAGSSQTPPGNPSPVCRARGRAARTCGLRVLGLFPRKLFRASFCVETDSDILPLGQVFLRPPDGTLPR